MCTPEQRTPPEGNETDEAMHLHCCPNCDRYFDCDGEDCADAYNVYCGPCIWKVT